MTKAGAVALREQLRWLERNSKPGDVFTDDWRDTWQDVHRLLAALDDYLDNERQRATDRLHMRAAVAVAADELAELVAGLAPNAVVPVAVVGIGVRLTEVEQLLRGTLDRNRKNPTEPPLGGGQ